MILYSSISEDFYIKKAKVEVVSDHANVIKRPYKTKARELALFSLGVESTYTVVFGIGTFLWLGTGAFTFSRNPIFQVSLCLIANCAANFLCDYIKIKILYPKYEDTIVGVLLNYSFKDDERIKIIYK
jgi:hypothetical protein